MYREQEYFSPEVLAKVGDYEINAGIEIKMVLDLKKDYDFVNIKITPAILKSMDTNFVNNFTKSGDDIEVFLGYNEKFEKVFTGIVTSYKNDEITGKNYFYKISNILINRNFTNCTFDEMLKFILNQGDITNIDIKTEATSVKKLLNIKDLNGLEAIKYIEQKWGIKDSIYYFENDKFIYNGEHKQSKIQVFKYAENILNIENIEKGFWEIETISVPSLKLRDIAYISHPKLQGEFQVISLKFTVNQYGFVRTKFTIKI